MCRWRMPKSIKLQRKFLIHFNEAIQQIGKNEHTQTAEKVAIEIIKWPSSQIQKKEHNNEPTQANTHTKMTSYQLMAIKTD